MAKIIEEVVVVKFSRIVKDDSSESVGVTEEIRTALEQVAQELAGENIVVEAVQVE